MEGLESKDEDLSFDPETVIRSALSKQTEAVAIIQRQRGELIQQASAEKP